MGSNYMYGEQASPNCVSPNQNSVNSVNCISPNTTQEFHWQQHPQQVQQQAHMHSPEYVDLHQVQQFMSPFIQQQQAQQQHPVAPHPVQSNHLQTTDNYMYGGSVY